APDLTAAVAEVLHHLSIPVPEWPAWTPPSDSVGGGGWLRGLYSGGTLCVEASVIAAETLGPVRSNVPLRPDWTVVDGGDGHVILDLGADEYTLGRPHPMLDLGPRLAMIKREAADPRTAVLLLDV